jgi:hypothetical protein
MSGEKPSSEIHTDELNERLNAGIETCRSVVANYRSLLAGGHAAADEEPGNSELSHPGLNDCGRREPEAAATSGRQFLHRSAIQK